MSALLHPLACAALAAAMLLPAMPALAQSEALTQTVGADTQRVFAHTSLPGATGIDFSFTGGISPMYPIPESHTLVTVFEWGPTATGPWFTSPDNVNTVPAAMTTPIATSIFHAPADAAFVAIHFYAGGLMTVSGTFTHTSVVPEPDAATLWLAGLCVAVLLSIRRQAGGTA